MMEKLCVGFLHGRNGTTTDVKCWIYQYPTFLVEFIVSEKKVNQDS